MQMKANNKLESCLQLAANWLCCCCEPIRRSWRIVRPSVRSFVLRSSPPVCRRSQESRSELSGSPVDIVREHRRESARLVAAAVGSLALVCVIVAVPSALDSGRLFAVTALICCARLTWPARLLSSLSDRPRQAELCALRQQRI